MIDDNIYKVINASVAKIGINFLMKMQTTVLTTDFIFSFIMSYLFSCPPGFRVQFEAITNYSSLIIYLIVKDYNIFSPKSFDDLV